ncbi:hypothetical protein SDC9_186200 [bioreactor metagenome]|uniref:Uncharacterized protein n=1 Tax=bioreactor metagenome TaxID=1076179 RepID=A0A645HI32_9ZZZZ
MTAESQDANTRETYCHADLLKSCGNLFPQKRPNQNHEYRYHGIDDSRHTAADFGFSHRKEIHWKEISARGGEQKPFQLFFGEFPDV